MTEREGTERVTWMLIIALGLATYALRASFLVLGQREMPRLQGYLRFVPAAVLPALIASAVTYHAGEGNAVPSLAAAAVGAWVAWRARSVAATMLAGMVALWLMQAWMP